MKRVLIFLGILLVVITGILAAGCVQSDDISGKTQEKTSVDYFREIAPIPHPSGNEDKMREYLIEFAKEHNLKYDTNEVGDLLISRPGTPGSPKVILQAHMDMVPAAVKGKDFDFTTQPVPVIEKDGLFTADGTSLGADDVSGIAIILSILASPADTYKNLNLSALFTVEEETTSSGAANVDLEYLDGDILINIDHTSCDEILISSAGIAKYTVKLTRPMIDADETLSWYTLTVSDLDGGHSGDDIDKNRGNAIIILSSILAEMDGVVLSSINGGTAPNAIPSHADAVFGIPASINADKIISEKKNTWKEQISDSNLNITLTKSEKPEKSFRKEETQLILATLQALPNGVLDIDENGMVKTSSNIGEITTENNTISIWIATRGEDNLELLEMVAKIQYYLSEAGFTVEREKISPGWITSRDSKLVQFAESAYKKLFSEDLKVSSTHAAIETGYFATYNPDLAIISCGPTYTGAHSPGEQMYASDLEKSEQFVKALLKLIESDWNSPSEK